MSDEDDFTPLTPEEDAALDRLLEPLRVRRRQLEPINDGISLEEMEAYAQLAEGAWLHPERVAQIEECCRYFPDTREIIEAIRHPDPGLRRAMEEGFRRGMAEIERKRTQKV